MDQTTGNSNSTESKEKPYQRYRRLHPERVKEQEKQRYQRRAEYQQQWRDSHKDEHSTYLKMYREQNLEEVRAKNREYNYSRRLRNRLEVLSALGGKCVRCGIDDWRVLQIDHINGGGSQERKQVTSIDRYYRDMLLSPEKYQALCANCHQIKRYEEKEGRKYR
jgi:predicted HNH restriction endonuclease